MKEKSKSMDEVESLGELPEIHSYRNRSYHEKTNFKEKAQKLLRTTRFGLPRYLQSFLPALSWLPRYNRKWFVRDLIAGITVGVMVIPESLAYAKLAHVPLQYGLYSSFIGAMIYTFLGTTREIAIGPAAVLSLLIGEAVQNVQKENPDANFKPQEIAACLSFYASFVALFLGLTRLASVLDLIPEPVIIGFTTGAALTIILSQLPSLLGIPNVIKGGSTVQQIYQTFYNVPNISWLDVVFGIVSLLFICALKFGTVPFLKKLPWLFYIKVGANGIAVIVFTITSYLLSIYVYKDTFNLQVVGEVPSGIKDVGVPNLDPTLLSSVSTELIPIILVMVLEHISICRLFARKGKYQISAPQELFAIGVCNLSASFLSAFPTTGSFTRSAVNLTSSIVTPLSGMVVGSIVIFAIYMLTHLFYYIPIPTLASIIVVAASSLIVDYKTVKELFDVQPFEGIILVVAGVLTFFVSAEVGILAAVGLSFVLMIYRIARPHIYILNQVLGRSDAYIDCMHPRFKTIQPIPGVLIFRPQESLTFPNIDYIKNSIIDTTIELTDPGNRDEPVNSYLWAEDIITRSHNIREYRRKVNGGNGELSSGNLPKLRGIILDFSAVNTLDASGIEGLLEIRDVLTDYAGYFTVPLVDNENENKVQPNEPKACLFEMHFVSVHASVINLLDRASLSKPIPSHFDTELLKDLDAMDVVDLSQLSPSKITLHLNDTTESLDMLVRSPSIFPTESNIEIKAVKNKYTPSRSFTTTIDPIAFTPSKFVHLTVADAVRRLQKRIDVVDLKLQSSLSANENHFTLNDE